MSRSIKAWHFSEVNRRLRYEDDRKIVLGKTLRVRCEPVPCENGLHASIELIDALKFAPGPILFRVAVGGTVKTQSDKICGTSRRAIWSLDLRPLLREYALGCLKSEPRIHNRLAAGLLLTPNQEDSLFRMDCNITSAGMVSAAYYLHYVNGGGSDTPVLYLLNLDHYRPLTNAIHAEIARRKLPL